MSTSRAPRIAYVVSHTHWDREWYLPYHAFRVMLVRTVDGVLDALEAEEGEYRHFCLDGQTVVLEDYLEIRPEARERIRRLVGAGALAIGPFYVLPDEFLIPPEATVRNLVYGRRAAEAIGEVQRVGYLPDPFGHPAQLPQILRRAGIDSFAYMRGDDDESAKLGLEWTWRAPDGSEVLALHLLDSYCNASALGHAEMWHAHTPRTVDPARAVEQVGERFDRMSPLSGVDVRLLMNGCDHHPVQRDFARILSALRGAYPETKFVHGPLGEFVEAVRTAGGGRETHEGELLGGRRHHILSGVWSARMPLKQQNDEAHTLLADVWEPLVTWARFQHGIPYPRGLVDHAWKLLLKNQPHDSICGCSVDEVHEEMGPRFDGVVQTAERSIEETLQTVVRTFGRQAAGDRDTVLAVFNPLRQARPAVLERLVVLEPLDYDVDALRVLTPDGRPLPFEIVARHRVRRFWGVDWRTVLDVETQQTRFDTYAEAFGDHFLEPRGEDDPIDTFLHLRVLADLPPCGMAKLRLTEAEDVPVPAVPDPVEREGNTLTNGLVGVRLHPNGTFDLTDERSERVFPGLNLLEDVEDVGDEYDYSPAARTQTVDARDLEGVVRVVADGPLAGALEARFVLVLPGRIDASRRRRVEERVPCPVVVRVRLEASSPVVDVDVHFDNQAEDHRLQVRFPTGIETDTVTSDAHFLLAERPVDRPEGRDWAQPPPDTVPQQEFSLVSDDAGGIAVLNRGLPEIAAQRAGDGSVDLRLTLLRCVGWLSRDDFPTRRNQNAGPTVPTPGAQCLGLHRFRYAVLPFAHDPIEADVAGWSRRWRTPLPCVQGVADGALGDVPGLVAATSDRVRVTAVKRAERGDGIVVRLHDLTGSAHDEGLVFGLDVARAWKTDLLERRETELEVPGGREVVVPLGPYEIATIEVLPRE